MPSYLSSDAHDSCGDDDVVNDDDGDNDHDDHDDGGEKAGSINRILSMALDPLPIFISPGFPKLSVGLPV